VAVAVSIVYGLYTYCIYSQSDGQAELTIGKLNVNSNTNVNNITSN